MRRSREDGVERAGVEHRLKRVEPRQPLGRTTLARRRERIEYMATADRAIGLRVAHHEPIARQRANRPLEHELNAGTLTGAERVAIEQRDMRDLVLRAQMHMQRRPMLQRKRYIGK